MDYTPGGNIPPDNNRPFDNRQQQNYGYQQPGGNNQPPYGGQGGYYSPSFNMKQPSFIPHETARREKAKIRNHSSAIGIAIILYLGLSSIVVALLQFVFTALRDNPAFNYSEFSTIWNSPEVQTLFEMLYSVIVVGCPFFIIFGAERKMGFSAHIPMGKPKNPKVLPVLVFGAFGICLIGDIITSVFDSIFESFTGVEMAAPEMSNPSGISGFILLFIGSAIVPALVEEVALRGIVMQPLRRNGDMYAILCSSMIFGLMHCNLVQIPFAFIAGIAIGYVTIAADSVWAGMIVHFLNNAFSVIVSSVYDKYGISSREYAACNIAFYIFIVIGLICVFFYFTKCNKVKLNSSPIVNSGKKFIPQMNPYSAKISNKTLFGSFVGTIPMVVALCSIIYETVLNVVYK